MKRSLFGVTAVMSAVVLTASACTSVSSSSGGSSHASSGATGEAKAPTGSGAASGDAPSASDASSSTEMGIRIPSAGADGSGSSSSSSSSSDAGGADASSTGGLVQAKVGDEAKTNDMSVKFSKVVDPVPSGDSSVFKPTSGNKWVAVHLSVTNLSSKPLSFSPMFCLSAKTTKNTSAKYSIMASYGTPFESSALQKGDTSVGDVVFEVPTDAKLKSVDIRCTLSGYDGDQRAIRYDLNN